MLKTLIMNSFVAVISLLPLFSMAFKYETSGARSFSLGKANVTLHDLWSANNNSAGLVDLTKFKIGLSHQNNFGLSEMNVISLQTAMPISYGTIGVNIQQYGYSQYSENKFGIAYGMKIFKNINAGVQFNYVSIMVAEPSIPNKHGFYAQIGLQSKLTPKLHWGFSVVNALNNSLSGLENEKLATYLAIGLKYKFSETLFVVMDIDKNTLLPANLKLGIEYHPIEILYFRTGFQSLHQQLSAGIGLELKKLQLDLGFAHHPYLGWQSEISLSYGLNKP